MYCRIDTRQPGRDPLDEWLTLDGLILYTTRADWRLGPYFGNLPMRVAINDVMLSLSSRKGVKDVNGDQNTFKSHYKRVVYLKLTTNVKVLFIGSVFVHTLCHPPLWDIPCRSVSANDCSTQLKIINCTI